MNVNAVLAAALGLALAGAARAEELVIATVNNGHMIEMQKLGKKRILERQARQRVGESCNGITGARESRLDLCGNEVGGQER